MTKVEALKELSLVISEAIKDSLSQDHAETPYVKALNLKSLVDRDIENIAETIAKDLANICETPPGIAKMKKPDQLKPDGDKK